MEIRWFALLCVALILAIVAAPNGKTAAQKAWKPQKPKVASRNRASHFGPISAGKQQRVKTGHAAASFEDRTFAIMDSNRDGKITDDEVEAARLMLSKEFSSGHLNDTVRKRLSTALSSFDVMRVDMDKDGVLTKREWRGMTASWREQSAKGWRDTAFQFMDMNGDGKATRGERANALKSLRKMRHESEEANLELRDGHRRLLAFLEKDDGKFSVGSFDGNGDGVLKLDEFLAGPKTVSKALPTASGRAQHGRPQTAKPPAKSQAAQPPQKMAATRGGKGAKGLGPAKAADAKPSNDWRSRAFAFLDRDADLGVDVDEFEEAHAALRQNSSAGVRLPMEQLWLLRHLDADGAWHARVDQNGDGRISVDELLVYDSSSPVSRDARDGKRFSEIEL